MPLYPGTPGPYGLGLTRQRAFDAQTDFGFVGDLISVGELQAAGSSVVMTSGSPTITLTVSAPFVVGRDEGKRIIVEGAGATNAPLVTTILSVSSTSVATLSSNAGTTVTSSTTVEINVSFGTNNAAAITAMTTLVNTTNAVFPGVRIFFGPSETNAYWFTSPVVFNKPVQLEGIGGGHTADSGNYTRIGGTRLAWGGTTFDGGTNFGAFFTFVPTGVQSLKRCAVRSLWLDCRNNNQNQALIGLKLSSCHGSIVEDFFVADALAVGIWTDIGTTPTEAKDTTRFSFQDICFRQLDNGTIAALAPVTTPFLMTSAVVLTTTPQNLTVAANALPAAGYLWTETTAGNPALVKYTGGGGTGTLTGCIVAIENVVNTPTTVNGGNIVQACPGNGAAMLMAGGSGANTCCGMLTMLQVSHGTTWGPAGVEFYNSDSIIVNQMMMNGGNATDDGAINRIRKPGVRLNGSIVSTTLAARNNFFLNGDPSTGGVSQMGVNNAGARLLAQAGPNYWEFMQLGNGAPVPVVEGDSYFQWNPNGGFLLGSAVAIASQTITAATLTLITGSLIAVPPQGFQIGTTLRWALSMSKTAAGTAARTFFIKIGTLGTTADATVATFTNAGVGTAAIDQGRLVVTFTVRGPLGAACAGVAESMLSHNLAATGFGTKATDYTQATMATWNSATAQQFISLHVTTGAAEVITVQQCVLTVLNSANP